MSNGGIQQESLEVVRASRCAGCWRRDGGVLERDAWAVGGEGGEKAARSAMGAVVLGIGLGRAELWALGIVPGNVPAQREKDEPGRRNQLQKCRFFSTQV